MESMQSFTLLGTGSSAPELPVHNVQLPRGRLQLPWHAPVRACSRHPEHPGHGRVHGPRRVVRRVDALRVLLRPCLLLRRQDAVRVRNRLRLRCQDAVNPEARVPGHRRRPAGMAAASMQAPWAAISGRTRCRAACAAEGQAHRIYTVEMETNMSFPTPKIAVSSASVLSQTFYAIFSFFFLFLQ